VQSVANTYGIAERYSNCYSHGYSDGLGNCNADGNRYVHRNSYSHGDGYGYCDGYSAAEGYSITQAAGDTISPALRLLVGD
jgi:hypothetical protein